MGCSVYGALVWRGDSNIVEDLLETFTRAKERGRDSCGLWRKTWDAAGPEFRFSVSDADLQWFLPSPIGFALVGNRRGEPTTEWVQEKREADAQPFVSPSSHWVFTHNGTIANDAEIYAQAWREDHDPPTRIDSFSIGIALDQWRWPDALVKLKGSFAIIAAEQSDPRTLFYATNYKPLYYRGSRFAVQVASQSDYLDHDHNPLSDPGVQRIEPYTYGEFRYSSTEKRFHHTSGSLFNLHSELHVGYKSVLVVCSGGLDSSTVAWKYLHEGWDVALLHFLYDAKAQKSEISAVMDLAAVMFGDRMEEHVRFVNVGDFFRSWAPSALTDPDVKIHHERGGEAGAEFAFEWVPARNLVFLALATAIAEAQEFPHIAIGVNLEEAGAYPDNEQEFGNLFNRLLPYATKAYWPVTLLQPYADRMKHEIVADGLRLGMPYEVTWSCYESGSTQCGSCGPCMMRKTAFAMNGRRDPAFEMT